MSTFLSEEIPNDTKSRFEEIFKQSLKEKD